MQLPRPAVPVARKSSYSGSDSVQPIELSTTTLRRSFRDRAESIERYPTPPLEAQERDSIPEVIEPEIYFRLTVKQGLLMYVSYPCSLRAFELTNRKTSLSDIAPPHSSPCSSLCWLPEEPLSRHTRNSNSQPTFFSLEQTRQELIREPRRTPQPSHNRIDSNRHARLESRHRCIFPPRTSLSSPRFDFQHPSRSFPPFQLSDPPILLRTSLLRTRRFTLLRENSTLLETSNRTVPFPHRNRRRLTFGTSQLVSNFRYEFTHLFRGSSLHFSQGHFSRIKPLRLPRQDLVARRSRLSRSQTPHC